MYISIQYLSINYIGHVTYSVTCFFFFLHLFLFIPLIVKWRECM